MIDTIQTIIGTIAETLVSVFGEIVGSINGTNPAA